MLPFYDNILCVNTIILIICFLALLYYLSTSTYNYWEKRNVYYVKPTPLFGNMLPIITRRVHIIDEFWKIYRQGFGKKYIGFFQMRQPALMIIDPTLISNILIKDFSYFSDHIQFGDPEKTPLVNHLFNMKEEQWKIMRQKLSPAFTPSKLKLMYDPIVECSAQLLKNIETTLHESKTIEVRDIFENYSIDVIGTCAYGLKLNAINDSNSPFRKHGKSTFSQLFKAIFRDLCLLITPRLKPFLIISDFSKETVDFFTSTLKSTIKYREENNIKRNDVVKYLIRAKNDLIINKNSSSVRFQEMDIVANAFVMFIAGSEPISGTISFCLYELALKKDIQCQVRQEMLSVKLKHGTINSDYINDLQYLDMVILETLRKYPILSFLYRITTKPYAVPNDNLVIEKGTRIFIPAYYIHHDYRYYSDPMNFNPQRFSRENKANQQVGTYMPFGLGPRTCIGNHFADLEIKLALTDLLTRYDVEPCELTSIPMIFSKSSPLISPDNGIWLKFNTLNE